MKIKPSVVNTVTQRRFNVSVTFDNVEMVDGLCQTAPDETAGKVGCISSVWKVKKQSKPLVSFNEN